MTYGLIGGAQQEITTPPNFGIIGPSSAEIRAF